MKGMNIRTRLLVIFTALFTVVFLGATFWFHQFTTTRAMEDLRQNLMVSAGTAAEMIDADEHTQLLENGEDGDAQYEAIAETLRMVRDANPKVMDVYTAVRSEDDPNILLIGVSAEEDEDERLALGDEYDASASPQMLLAFDGPSADENIGEDEYGTWLSGYAPILDESGRSVGIVGVDMEADGVLEMQGRIRSASLVIFLAGFLVIFVTTYFLSGSITRPLRTITDAARMLENDEKVDPQTLAPLARGKDELSHLARVFQKMAEQVQDRQQKLKQEVERLKVEIDEVKRKKDVSDIVDSDFFKDLKSKARELKKKDSPGS